MTICEMLLDKTVMSLMEYYTYPGDLLRWLDSRAENASGKYPSTYQQLERQRHE